MLIESCHALMLLSKECNYDISVLWRGVT